MKLTIYHNPSCSKSCAALAGIERTTGREVEVINYLDNPPGADELRRLTALLGITPMELIRQNEPEFAPYAGRELSADECIRLMTMHPVLIQRPIVVQGDKAVILQPPLTPENFLS